MFLEGFCRIGRIEVRSAASHRSARLAKKHFVASPTVSAVPTRNPDFLGLHRATIGLTAEKKNAKSEDTTPSGSGIVQQRAFRDVPRSPRSPSDALHQRGREPCNRWLGLGALVRRGWVPSSSAQVRCGCPPGGLKWQDSRHPLTRAGRTLRRCRASAPWSPGCLDRLACLAEST